MWNANPLQAERLSFIHCGWSTQGGSSLLFLTPNPRCGDVECQPPAGREIVVYTLWLENTREQFTFFLTPSPRCGDVECQPPASLRDCRLYIVARVHKGAVHLLPNA